MGSKIEENKEKRAQKIALENEFRNMGYLERDNEHYQNEQEAHQTELERIIKIRSIVNNMDDTQRRNWLLNLHDLRKAHDSSPKVDDLR